MAAGEHVILSMTVWRSVWNASRQLLIGHQKGSQSLPCMPFLAMENATEYAGSEVILYQRRACGGYANSP